MENFDCIISSMGGVASTSIMQSVDFACKCKINKNRFAAGTDPYKHAMKPQKEWKTSKAVFIYGNPVISFFSFLGRGDNSIRTHLRNMGQFDQLEKIKYSKNVVEDVIKMAYNNEDIFNFEDMFNNWIHSKTDYPRLIVDYAWLLNTSQPDNKRIFESFIDERWRHSPKVTERKTTFDEFNPRQRKQRIVVEEMYSTLIHDMNKIGGHKIIDNQL